MDVANGKVPFHRSDCISKYKEVICVLCFVFVLLILLLAIIEIVCAGISALGVLLCAGHSAFTLKISIFLTC